MVDTLEWTYNVDGTVATAGNDEGTYSFTYDDSGRVIQVEEPFGVTLTFGYDQYGNRNLVKDNLGGEEDSLYNANGQLLSRTLTQDGETLRIDFTHDQFGNVATETRYSDAAGTDLVATTTYTYDSFGTIVSIVTNTAADAPIDAFYYGNDSGQITSEMDYQPTLSSSMPTTDYSYDSQGQLTAAGSTSYSYDSNGNSTTSGYTYNPSDTNEITSDGTWNYSYDADGNITEKVNISTGGYWTYAYDNRNELVQANEYDVDNDLLSESVYKYDVFGNRVEQDVTVSGVTTVQRYALDGWDPAKSSTPVGNENFDVWADLDGSNNLETRYLRGDTVDQLLGRVDVSGDTGTAYWTITDSLGSVRDVIDNTGAVADSLSYDAFGNITAESDPTYRGRYAWTGRELDVETGLQYNRARYYDSTTGRWISQDPLGFDAGDSNLYRYVKNSPTNASDPSGTDEVTSRSGVTYSYSRKNDAGTPYQKQHAVMDITALDGKIAGKLIVDNTVKKGKLNTGNGTGTLVGFEPTGKNPINALKVKWIQFSSNSLYTKQPGKDWVAFPNQDNLVTRTVPIDAGLPNSREQKYVTSNPSAPFISVDAALKTSPLYSPPSEGNESNSLSWIYDNPNMAHFLLRDADDSKSPALKAAKFATLDRKDVMTLTAVAVYDGQPFAMVQYGWTYTDIVKNFRGEDSSAIFSVGSTDKASLKSYITALNNDYPGQTVIK